MKMSLDEFVIKSAEKYIELREKYPNDMVRRVAFTEQVLGYIKNHCPNETKQIEYMSEYYRLRGERS